MEPPPLDPEALLVHVAHVRQLARRLVFDADLAREVEQDTWVAALEHAPRDLRHPRAWLSQVTRHVARRVWARREHGRDVEREQGRARHEERSARAEGDTPPDLVEREQALRRLLAAVDRLPEPVKTTVVLHHLDGLPLREVAQRTGVPLETVRSRSKRGLALLREDLARQEHGGGAWTLGLVQGLELAPLEPVHGLLLCLRDLLLPLTLMSTGLKLASATGATALCLLLAWTWTDREDAPRVRGAVEPSTPIAAPELGLPGRAKRTEVVEGSAQDEPRVIPVETAPPAAPRTTGTLAIELAWAGEERPAAGVPLSIEALGRGRLGDWRTSDGDGLVVVDDLAPAQYMLSTLFGGMAFGQVVAGETVEVRLSIPEGLAIHGRVLDAAGEPVPDATLHLWPGGLFPMFEALPVTRSDGRGEFELPSVPAGVGAALFATEPGRAPTERVMLTGAPGDERTLEVIFRDPGRAVAGIVLAPDGTPLEGAEVVVGSERETLIRKRTDGTLAYPPMGQRVRTGPDGRFEIEGAALGELPVQARGTGSAPWQGRLPEGEGWIRIQLERGALVRGVITTAEGSPPSRATVQNGAPLLFRTHFVHADSDGTFEIGPLAPGEHELVAAGNSLRAELRLTLQAGEERVWDPVLGSGPEIHGWIEAPGQDTGEWTVLGYAPPASGAKAWSGRTRSRADGTFSLPGVPDRTVRVTLFHPGAPYYVTSVPEVRADGSPLVLRPDPERWPTATVSGRLVDADGNPILSADLRLHNLTFGPKLIHPDPVDGSFRVGPLPEGEWVLEQDPLTPGWAVGRTAFTLTRDRTLDLGSLTLGPGGSIEVNLRRSPSSEPTRLEVVDCNGWPVETLSFEGDRATSRPLEPGVYRVVARGVLEGAVEPREVAVTAGSTTALEIELP